MAKYLPAMNNDWTGVCDVLLPGIDVVQEIKDAAWIRWHPVVGPSLKVVVINLPALQLKFQTLSVEPDVNSRRRRKAKDPACSHRCRNKKKNKEGKWKRVVWGVACPRAALMRQSGQRERNCYLHDLPWWREILEECNRLSRTRPGCIRWSCCKSLPRPRLANTARIYSEKRNISLTIHSFKNMCIRTCQQLSKPIVITSHMARLEPLDMLSLWKPSIRWNTVSDENKLGWFIF